MVLGASPPPTPIAQLAEQRPFKSWVASSSLAGGTKSNYILLKGETDE